jgi:hypothetical protein
VRSGAVLDAAHSVASGGAASFPDEKKFYEYVEPICEDFYGGEVGRPVLSVRIHAAIDSPARCWSDAIHTSVISGMRR